MNRLVQTSNGPQFAVLVILLAGIILLYCIRKRLVPQLLFLIVFAAAVLTLVYGLAANLIWLIVISLVVALGSVAGFTRSYCRHPMAAV